MRRAVHLVGHVLEVVFDLLAFGAQRVGLPFGRFLIAGGPVLKASRARKFRYLPPDCAAADGELSVSLQSAGTVRSRGQDGRIFMERRLRERIETNVHLTCRVPARPCRTTVQDLSANGCRLELPDANIELGGTVLLDLPGEARFPGRVVWIRGNLAGIQFFRQLTGPAAVVLGIEAPAPEPEEPEPVEDPNLKGFLRHWMRRLTGRFA